MVGSGSANSCASTEGAAIRLPALDKGTIMNRSHKVLGFILGALVLAGSAQGQMYSQIGGTGTVTFGGFTHSASNGSLTIDGGNETRVVFNVTNPRDISSPSWTTLEILAVDGGSFSTTNARLVRVPRTTGSPETTLCSLISSHGLTPATYSCTFSSSLIDFANYYYYIRVFLLRNSLSEYPAIYGVRVF